jgi:hypothetical protein
MDSSVLRVASIRADPYLVAIRETDEQSFVIARHRGVSGDRPKRRNLFFSSKIDAATGTFQRSATS